MWEEMEYAVKMGQDLTKFIGTVRQRKIIEVVFPKHLFCAQFLLILLTL